VKKYSSKRLFGAEEGRKLAESQGIKPF